MMNNINDFEIKKFNKETFIMLKTTGSLVPIYDTIGYSLYKRKLRITVGGDSISQIRNDAIIIECLYKGNVFIVSPKKHGFCETSSVDFVKKHLTEIEDIYSFQNL